MAALAGATDGPDAPPADTVVEAAGLSSAPLEGGPDEVSFSPVSVAERAMARLTPPSTTAADGGAGATTSSSTSSAPTTEAPATTTTADTTASASSARAASPSTSAAPATAPSTTAPPTTAAPTTQAPPPQPEPAGQGYAYDDPRSTQVWLDLAQCEAGGNWAADTGNGYYGGLQFSLSSWQGVGGRGYPHEHGRDTQIEMGRRLQAAQGWGAWPHCSRELGLR